MLRLRAYAKINLSLKILGKRPDGFHALDSIMQSISLWDELFLTPITSGIQLTTNHSQLTTDNKNLAYRAAEVFFREDSRKAEKPRSGVKIHLEKNIPLAAGLAGGSADAAAVLYGLNQMTNDELRITNEGLIKLGAEIGSDVPFCLTGGNCTVGGRGEILTPNPSLITRYYVLVVPDVEVSTKWAYEAFDEMTNPSTELRINYELRITNEGGGNDLEFVVIKKYPVIQQIKEKLLALGCGFAQMSGSGPSVFGEVRDVQSGEKILNQIKKEFPRSYLVHSVSSGVD